jgi:hypothetical protein
MIKNTTKESTSRVNTSVNSIESFLKMSLSSGESTAMEQQLSYHEMEDIPVRETATLEQLEKNVQLLGDLRSRLQFMNREVRYLLKL